MKATENAIENTANHMNGWYDAGKFFDGHFSLLFAISGTLHGKAETQSVDIRNK